MSNTTDLTRGIYRRQYSGFIKGQRINHVSLEAEAWFWRVLAIADDFGNADADPELVWLATRGKRKGITVQQVSGWLREMKDAKLIETYKVKDEHFLHVVDFEDLQPAGKNGKRIQKYPLPVNAGESRLIQINPDLPEKSQASHSHSHTDNHTQDQTTTPLRASRSAEQRGTRLPKDFSLSEDLRLWASDNAAGVDVDAALAEFRDYWCAVAGARGRKLDWDATFRNRLRELATRKENHGTSKSIGYQTNAERRDADFRGYAAVIAELREQGGGAVDETVRRKSLPS